MSNGADDRDDFTDGRVYSTSQSLRDRADEAKAAAAAFLHGDNDGDEDEEPLMLANEEERLPWLESDDDHDEGGVDVGRLVALGLVALVALLGLLGLLWLLSKPDKDAELLAEGSTIEAPAEPYRTAPDDPGGTQVTGTGDMSFEVGEGQSRDSQLASSDVTPSIDTTQGAGSASASSGTASASGTAASGSAASARPNTSSGTTSGTSSGTAAGAAASGGASGVPIQVAAYSSRARAEQGWSELSGRYDALSGLNHRIEEATVDGATVYRVQALAGSVSAADSVCRAVRAAGGDCQVKR